MKDFTTLLAENLPFTPNEEQSSVLAVLTRFVESTVSRAALMLGYAGTGKTSLVSALVRSLDEWGIDCVLLAPTGRAAKVFAKYSGHKAYTIHKTIYRQRSFDAETAEFSLDYNKRRRAIFIVDEASMISNEGGGGAKFGTGRLLDDLVRFVYSGRDCKLLLVGDTAQLPPVGEEESPALSLKALNRYGLQVDEVTLRQVMRQGSDTGVLANATMLRNEIAKGEPAEFPKIHQRGYDDLSYLSGNELIDELESCYGEVGEDETIVVTRSNKRAFAYNMGIRASIFGREERITEGDRIMVAKNNYFWTAEAAAGDDSHAAATDFIANGDVAQVERIYNFHEMGGFHFADATLLFPDYDDLRLDARLLLDTLSSESPSLTREESAKLYQVTMEKYARFRSRSTKMKKLRQDPHYNAMQIKYAYAVTCHKAQGGQWSRVFLDQGPTPPDMLSQNYLRWLYTAFTRTTDKLYLVNWPSSQRAEPDEWDF